MSQINVNRIKDSNEGAPDFPSGVNVSGITSCVTLAVSNLKTTKLTVSCIVTATTLDGSLPTTGTPTLGLGVTINASGLNISGVATAGIVSATTLYGNGANITGIALSIAPLNYNPATYGADLSTSPGIGFTFNQAVKAGSGNVTLRVAGAAGTVVQNWGVGSSITYSNGDTISMSLDSNLSNSEVYHLSYPSGAFTNTGGDVSYVGTAYTFSSKPLQYQLWTWGINEYGQLGDGTTANKSSPIQIPGLTWTDAVAMSQSSLAIKTDGTLWGWGRNAHGELGLNSLTAPASPVQIGTSTTWEKLPTRNRAVYSMAIKTDGTLWAWGYNGVGQLGQGSYSPANGYSSPVQIPGTTWSSTAASGNWAAAIKTDGTLWSWGYNFYGQLGLNTEGGPGGKKNSPNQVGTDTTWSYITSMTYGAAALKTDGTFWAWGKNTTGQIGNNTRFPAWQDGYSSPVQIPGTDWSTAGSTESGRFGIKTDGTLWNWGVNEHGQLGQNNRTDYSSPVQVPGTTWNTVGTSGFSILATKTDNTLWTWGQGDDGNLGLNTAIKVSSPTQIPGSWEMSKISGGVAQVKVLREV